MIKGKYVSMVTVDFCFEENLPGIFPFDELKEATKNELNEVIKGLIEEELGEISTVTVEQQYADLYRCDGE